MILNKMKLNNMIWNQSIKGLVYFIQMGEYGPIKIGFTTDLNSRMIGLQSSSPYKLSLLYSYSANIEEEKDWHGIFRDIQLEGEWFQPHQRLLVNINQHKATNEEFKKKEEKFLKKYNRWGDTYYLHNDYEIVVYSPAILTGK